MSNKKHHSDDPAHDEKEPKKTAEMKQPEVPTDDALFSDEPAFKESKQDSKKNQTAELEAELQQANDRMLRAHAELDNYRRRAMREMEDVRKYASIDLIRDMLPVWDNMGRALEAAEKTHDLETLIEGVKMMYEQFANILKQHHCERIEALGLPFDPNVHESISQMPSPDHEPGTVIFEGQIGFKLHDRVVRPTQVVLAGEK